MYFIFFDICVCWPRMFSVSYRAKDIGFQAFLYCTYCREWACIQGQESAAIGSSGTKETASVTGEFQ